MKVKQLLPLLLTVSLASCSSGETVFDNRSYAFDTVVITDLYKKDIKVFADVDEIIYYYDKLFDGYKNTVYKNVYTINHTNDDVEVKPELYEALKIAFSIQTSAYYFNPFIGSLSNKWKEALKNNEILSSQTIEEELEKMNQSSLVFKDNNIVQRIGDAEIDLGAFSKGYVLDQIADYFNKNDIANYLVDAGNSSILLGQKPSKNGLFSVGIKGIDDIYVPLKNCFISTSGTSVQGVEIGGVTYSHIINPYTGNAINNYDAVLVVGDCGYLTDVLSTSMMFNTLDEIKAIEESLSVKTILIKNNKVIYSHPELEIKHR